MKDRHPKKAMQQPCGLPAETFSVLRGVWSTRRCCPSYILVSRSSRARSLVGGLLQFHSLI